MESPPARCSISSQLKQPGGGSPNMSTLAIKTSSLLSSPSMMWQDRCSLVDIPLRPRSQPPRPEIIELPSIRQAVPEIQLRGTQADLSHRLGNTHYSPTASSRSLLVPFDYVPLESSHKRRRLSVEGDDAEVRDCTLSPAHISPSRPQRSQSNTLSPTDSARRASVVSAADSWSGPTRTSPHNTERGLPSVRSPPRFDTSLNSRSDWRPTLPTLPRLPAFLFEPNAPRDQRRHSNWGEYALDSSCVRSQSYVQQKTPATEVPLPSYQRPAFSYEVHPPRGQTFPNLSPTHISSQDRSPFSSNTHHAAYQGNVFPYGLEIGETGSLNKQRKRRGNLPKETTDTLRAWFTGHLQHPYPTEDEKQELMRQTGLQLNQISNWFINARRRQLPAMINNARVESGATAARGCVGKQQSNYGPAGIIFGDSDEEGSVYEEAAEYFKKT